MFQKILVHVILTLSLACLCACGNSASSESSNSIANYDTTISAAIVVGTHSNAPAPDVATFEDIVANVVEQIGSVKYIRCDGFPVAYETIDIEPLPSGLSATKIATINAQRTASLISLLSEGMTAQVAEVNTLKGIRMAGEWLSEISNTSVLVIYDSGLQTTGTLLFQDDILNDDLDIDDIVAQLTTENELPDLSGVDVYWIGIGDVASPQPPLSASQKADLKSLWRSILEASGANSITFLSGCGDSYTANYLTDLTVSIVPTEEVYVVPSVMPTQVLGTELVSFIGDTSIFVDTAIAMAAISSVAIDIQQSVYVVGTTASTSDKSYSEELSLARAQAVADVLIACGVDETMLIVIGAGYDNDWHIDDIDENGYQIEPQASQNRSVMIIDPTSEDGALVQEYLLG